MVGQKIYNLDSPIKDAELNDGSNWTGVEWQKVSFIHLLFNEVNISSIRTHTHTHKKPYA